MAPVNQIGNPSPDDRHRRMVAGGYLHELTATTTCSKMRFTATHYRCSHLIDLPMYGIRSRLIGALLANFLF